MRTWCETGWTFFAARWRRLVPLLVGLVVMGAVLGIERSLLPLMASAVWGQDSYKGKVAFIVSFGCAKAATNLLAGPIADRWGRKRALVAGMVLGLPVPIVVLFADSWSLVVAVNILFGASQGFIGSSLIFMMVDSFGVAAKGLAVGTSEMVIYSSVAAVSVAASAMAEKWGYRPVPFIVGAIISAIGLAASFLVTDTMDLVAEQQAAATAAAARPVSGAALEPATVGQMAEMGATVGLISGTTAPADADSTRHVQPSPSALAALLALARNSNFVLIALCGMVDKGKDAVIWGLAPEFLVRHGLSLATTGVVIGFYTGAWGVSQLFFGGLSDTYGRKLFLGGGLATNTVALLAFSAVPAATYWAPARILLWSASMALLGIGTAMTYPTMQAGAADEVEPAFRGSSLGIYRAMRDFGLAVGALSVSSVADAIGLDSSFVVLAGVVAAMCAAIIGGYRQRFAPAPLPCFA